MKRRLTTHANLSSPISRVAIALLCLAFLAIAAHGASIAAPALAGKRVLVLGDSITQDGRWVTYVEYYLNRLEPASTFDVIGIGLSSETASGLTEPGNPYQRPCVLERLGRALERIHPQVVFACYGMNDGIYHPRDPGRMAAFADGMNRLIAQVHASGAALVLLTPPPFDPVPIPDKLALAGGPRFGYGAFFAGYDEVLGDFARWQLQQARADVHVIDVHGAIHRELDRRRADNPSFTFSKDGVHPGEAGHLLMARTVLEGLGRSLAPANLEAEIARIAADPLFPLVKKRRETRSGAWLPFIGYTREKTVSADSVDEAETTVTDLQVQIDRLRRGG